MSLKELDRDGKFLPKKEITRLEAAVNRVTLSWGEKPNPGYRISIAQIVFADEQTAEIHYKLHYPEKGKSYAQVITTPTADT